MNLPLIFSWQHLLQMMNVLFAHGNNLDLAHQDVSRLDSLDLWLFELSFIKNSGIYLKLIVNHFKYISFKLSYYFMSK